MRRNRLRAGAAPSPSPLGEGPKSGGLPPALRSLPVRTVSGLASFAALVFVLWVGWPLLLPAIAFATVLGLYEYRTMAHRAGLEVGSRAMYVFGLLLIFVSLPLPDLLRLPTGLSWREVVLGAYLVYALVAEVVRPRERPLERVVYSVFGVLYVPFLLSYALLLRETPNHALGFWYLLAPIVAAFASDAGAFLFGSTLGRRKLAPEVSPNKTVEGAVGGLVFAFLFVFGLTTALPLHEWAPGFTVYDVVLFSVLVSSAAQLGDLAESVVKRSLGAKDSGSFLPGHGGLLDRLDSILFALPVAYYFVAAVVLG